MTLKLAFNSQRTALTYMSAKYDLSETMDQAHLFSLCT